MGSFILYTGLPCPHAPPASKTAHTTTLRLQTTTLGRNR